MCVWLLLLLGMMAQEGAGELGREEDNAECTPICDTCWWMRRAGLRVLILPAKKCQQGCGDEHLSASFSPLNARTSEPFFCVLNCRRWAQSHQVMEKKMRGIVSCPYFGRAITHSGARFSGKATWLSLQRSALRRVVGHLQVEYMIRKRR